MAQAFQHAALASAEGCSCPVHAGRERDPFTAPLGLPFADHVSVREIPRETAAAIYQAHHAYVRDLPEINLVHHGLCYQGQLVGAITYRYPFLSMKAMYYDTDGTILPEPTTDQEMRDALPERLWPTARRVLEFINQSAVHERQVHSGGHFIEAARICLAVRMPNLASAALARSQERFVEDYASEEEVWFLRTQVREDYDAAMIRALRDKGWRCTHWAPPSQASNRDRKAIRDYYRWVFHCPLPVGDGPQTTLGRWSP